MTQPFRDRGVERVEDAADRASAPSPAAAGTPRRANHARWRALALALVYLLIGLHIAHWRIAGRTLAPLELNEVMYTLELGIVTAGFVFMAFASLGTLLFGRFFCSWACHVLALEDLCAWLLSRLGVRPKPVRSRALLFVPPLAMGYMFVWPQVLRWYSDGTVPALHLGTDAEGWASFVTTDFWRNLPGPGVALATFAVCGFAIVWMLGSRAFCTYGCPYGAWFGALDRLAPGRIVARGDCSSCGRCTAVCQSHVRVHEELQRFGTVVNPACLKDLDCVDACPRGSVRYGFRAPPAFRSLLGLRRVLPKWDFHLGEELLAAGVVIATIVVFRGLYGLVPFLMTLGLGAIGGHAAVLLGRLATRRDVRLNPFQLRRAGRLTGAGAAYLAVAAIVFALYAHGGLLRLHDWRGRRALAAVSAELAAGRPLPRDVAQAALRELEACRDIGFLEQPGLRLEIARLRELVGDGPGAARELGHLLAYEPGHREARLALGRSLALQGEDAKARQVLIAGLSSLAAGAREREAPDQRHYDRVANELCGDLALRAGDRAAAATAYRAAISADGRSFAGHAGLGGLLADAGNLRSAVGHLARAAELEPQDARARYNLAVVLGALGNDAEARAAYEAALALNPSDAEAHNNLALLLVEAGDGAAAERSLRRAILLQPGLADAHFNLGRLLAARGESAEARAELGRAAALDPRFGGVPGPAR